MGHHQDRVASKTYTDDEALTKIVEYLEKAPMVTKVDQDDERKYSVSYFLEIKDKNGDLKYKIYFSSPVIEENIFCELYSVKNVNTDGTTDGESQFFCLDGEYLSEFLEDVETIDGREPCWLYADMFEEKFKSYDDPIYAVIKCGETVKEYTYDENSKDLGVEDLGVRLRYLPVRLAGDSDKEWQESLENVTVSFYDSDKKLICKCVLNGYVEDNNREQIMFYDGADSEGVLYLIKKIPHLEKTNFDYFMEDYLS